MKGVLCVGDVMIDAFLTIHKASLHCRLNKKDCELCVRYGEKIPVETCCFLLGGIACNVSVGLSRLGLPTDLVAEIGDDEFSQKIISNLSQEHVGMSRLVQTKGAAASFSIGINFLGERTLFVEHVERNHDFRFDNLAAQWVFLGGLGRKWQTAYEQTVAFVQKNKAKLAFTPGSGQFEEGTERFRNVIEAAYVLLVNLSEAQKILSTPQDNTSVLLTKLQELGPKIVSITDGKNGSCAIDEQGKVFSIGILPCPVIEKTGAGDAYASGFLGSLMLNQPVSEAMRWGVINAASVVGKVGAQEGLLDREALDVRLAHYPDVVAGKLS